MAVRAPGYLSVQRTIEIAPGADHDETFTLEPLRAPVPEPATPAPNSLHPADARASTSEVPGFAPASRHPLAGYLALGAAGVLAAGGVVAWRVRADNVEIYNDDNRCLVGSRTRGQQCGQYARVASGALAVEIGAFGVASASAGLGAWLVWTSGQRPGRTAWCSPWGQAGLQCAASF